MEIKFFFLWTLNSESTEHPTEEKKRLIYKRTVLGMNSEHVVYTGTYHKNYGKSDSF